MLAVKSDSEIVPVIQKHQPAPKHSRTWEKLLRLLVVHVSISVCLSALRGHPCMVFSIWMDIGFSALPGSIPVLSTQRQRGGLRSTQRAPPNPYSPIKPQGVWKILLALITFSLGSWGQWAWQAFVFKNLTCLPGKFSQALILLWFPAGDLVSRDMIKEKDISSGTYFT